VAVEEIAITRGVRGEAGARHARRRYVSHIDKKSQGPDELSSRDFHPGRAITRRPADDEGTPVDWVGFNRPLRVGTEVAQIEQAISNAHLSADGPFTERCQTWLREWAGVSSALLVTSCTAGLELAALLMEVGPGDEVIMPSFTFVTTATSFVLRGATPVFVDIRPDTLNLNEELVGDAITSRTKAIVPVHYAGIACEMDEITALAAAHGVRTLEDAAQGLMATYKGRPLGSLGDLAAISFHETKNVTCGEGGALLIRDEGLVERAEILRQKGTNRSQFLRGQVDKYTWVDVGSSYAMSDLNAAFLWAQLTEARAITERRLAIWHRYHEALAACERRGLLRRPIVPAEHSHNAHMYYVLLPTAEMRDAALRDLNSQGVNAVFHYVPLHSSPAGLRYGRAVGPMTVTDEVSAGLMRLPLWAAMSEEAVDRVIECVTAVVGAPDAGFS
jgi:dTDP-4-amino-4,6-dideoxygalactose transaminase